MKIFADFHHAGLAYSFHLLFEKQLGWEIYYPIGEDWFDKGYWSIAEPYDNHPDTIKQYLSLDQAYRPTDGTVPLNTLAVPQSNNYYSIVDLAHGYVRKAVTFEQFCAMPIDFIIGSIPRHWEEYTKLRDIYKKSARVICQMGNMFDEVEDMIRMGIVKNLMASTSIFTVNVEINRVFYHQHIDEEVFKPHDNPANNMITSFVNVLPARQLYYAYKTALPDFDFKAYGAGSPDGVIPTIKAMAGIMNDTAWAYHIKPGGDGFGHVLFDWAFIGRPIITRFNDYKGLLGGELLEDRVTAIDIEARSFEENLKLIKEWTTKDKLTELSNNMKRRRMKVVNYDKELTDILQFIENLA